MNTPSEMNVEPSGNPAPPTARSGMINVCTQCRRRKQKCDRAVPCSNCVRRAVPHLCHSSRHIPASRHGRSRSITRSPLPAASPIASLGDFPITSTQLAPRSPTVGRLWNTRGAPTFHGDSYFGHQSAADMMQIESPQLSMGMNGMRTHSARLSPRTNTYRSEKGPHAHIWELLGYLPRQKSIVDRLVLVFVRELNQALDGLHEETFMNKYNMFWNRKWSDDDAMAIDLRWLSLLFIVLAFGELLDCPADASIETQAECEETSLQFYWAARTSITLAMTFWGESPDAVRGSILITRYLLYLGRKTESWLSARFSISFGLAQGMHIDGASWGLPPKVLETRRRLWCTVHTLEKLISLGLGRPSSIGETNCMKMPIKNIWIADMSDEQALSEQERSLEDPTPSVYYIYEQNLTTIVGRIHNECFGMISLTTSYNAYEKVLNLDQLLLEWAESLPAYFHLNNPDKSMDDARPYIHWQRMSLHSAFHFARVTLHRTYLLRDSLTNRFQYSHDACVSSACADLKLKLSLRNPNMADRLRAGTATHNLCSSALVLGIIAIRDPLSPRTNALLEDLGAYCEKQNSDSWANEFVLAEVRVIELCISSARKLRQDAGLLERNVPLAPRLSEGVQRSTFGPTSSQAGRARVLSTATVPNTIHESASGVVVEGNSSSLSDDWLDTWFGPNRVFPDPGDYQSWENLVGTLEALQ